MKTKCLSCGGTTKKMQKGGSTDSTRTAPYVSPKGAFYPDKKSLESGCAKNPNSPECKKVIKTMSPTEAAKIKGRLQKGGAIKKMQNGGITKDGQKIKFPPIVKKEAIQESAPTRKTTFEKRQDKKIERAKTRSAIASIEGEGSVKDKRNSRANRIATVVGTGRQKVSRTSSTSTTSNTNSGNTNVSSGSDSGSTSGSRSTSGSTSGVSESGNSKNANETNNNSKNKRYQNGGTTSANFPKSAKYEKYTIDRILKKNFIKRPTPKKPTVTKSSSSVVIGSGNSSNNNSVNNNSNNKKIVITKKDNSINKSTNSRNRYQKGGSTSSVIGSGNSNNRNTINNNSNNTKIYKKKVDNSVNKSTGSRNTRIEKAKQKNVKVDRNRPIGGTYPFTFK